MPDISSPNHAVAITPADNTSLENATEWLSFTNSGTQALTITTVGGEKVTVSLPSGMWPIRASTVWATGTTVTNIVGYWS
jgi:hypothetical protein